MPSVSRPFLRWRGRAATALCVVLLLAGGLVVVTGSVASAAISAQGVNFGTEEYFAQALIIGTFTDTTPSAQGYTVSINWGDGQTTGGSAVANANGTFSVFGPSTHTYANDGIYTVSFSITEIGDDHDFATATAVGTVAEANRSINMTVPPISVTEGTVVSGTIATFTDGGTTDPASDFTASIDWGDGTTTAGIVSAASVASTYVVSGTHQYTDELGGSPPPFFLIDVTISEPGIVSYGNSNTVTISEADTLTMTGSSFTARAGRPFSGPVATFTDTNPLALASDFTTTINWGDGTTTSGTVAGPTGGPFTVTGSHTYKPARSFTVTVTAADDPPGTATASATATATVTHGRPPSGK